MNRVNDLARHGSQLLEHPTGVRKAMDSTPIRDLDILVPIALFASLSRRSLDTRNEGLWGHRIFESVRIFLIGC